MLAVRFTMVFTKFFGNLGSAYLIISLIDLEKYFSDNLKPLILDKDTYRIAGLISIGCGLLLDLFVWWCFLK
jgi:hypothetical protein